MTAANGYETLPSTQQTLGEAGQGDGGKESYRFTGDGATCG